MSDSLSHVMFPKVQYDHHDQKRKKPGSGGKDLCVVWDKVLGEVHIACRKGSEQVGVVVQMLKMGLVQGVLSLRVS